MSIPAPLLIAAGVLLLTGKRNTATVNGQTAAAAATAARGTSQQYATPNGVAGAMASAVNSIIKGLAITPTPTAAGVAPSLTAAAIPDAARAAVRAGDAYYGEESLAWFNSTGTGSGFPADGASVPGWVMPANLPVNPNAYAAYNNYSGDPYNPAGLLDNVAAAPVFDPSVDVASPFLASFGIFGVPS